VHHDGEVDECLRVRELRLARARTGRDMTVPFLLLLLATAAAGG
jgi:hypothetical protein